MFDLLEDGSHEITLHNIQCPGKAVWPTTTGTLKWSRECGLTYELILEGIKPSKLNDYYVKHHEGNSKVGTFLEADYSKPQWIAETDDTSKVELFIGIQPTPIISETNGTGGHSCSCSFKGKAIYGVVDIPTERFLSFKDSTEEDFRLFYIGDSGTNYHSREYIEFEGPTGNLITTLRSSIFLSESPRVSLVNFFSSDNYENAGWLSFENSPIKTGQKQGAISEQHFISFINGQSINFYWGDQQQNSNMVQRTYYGWIKSKERDSVHTENQPLPIMNGVGVFGYGDEVRDCLPELFKKFLELSQDIELIFILNPLWMALNSVVEDRLALASVSLERLNTMWKNYKEKLQINENEPKTIWQNKQLGKKIRRKLQDALDQILDEQELDQDDLDHLNHILTKNISNIYREPNASSLEKPFTDNGIKLSKPEKEALTQRNEELHGRLVIRTGDIKELSTSYLYFEQIRMLITKFILSACEYDGPYIDYASRPANGNYEIKRLSQNKNPS